MKTRSFYFKVQAWFVFGIIFLGAILMIVSTVLVSLPGDRKLFGFEVFLFGFFLAGPCFVCKRSALLYDMVCDYIGEKAEERKARKKQLRQ